MARARLAIDVSSMRLYNGRLSLYLSVTVWQTTFFLSRWDSDRVRAKPLQFDLWRGPIMCWYVGRF